MGSAKSEALKKSKEKEEKKHKHIMKGDEGVCRICGKDMEEAEDSEKGMEGKEKEQ